MNRRYPNNDNNISLRDYGPVPLVVNIEKATEQNNNFRTALWTGRHMQLTLMSLGPGEDIGLEMHPDVDQFLRIEEGQALVMMGNRRDMLHFQSRISEDYVVIVPAGTWHNMVNIGNKPLKLYSIYAPPQHPRGTVHRTKAEAEAAERH
ncbi:MAG: cupin domain-containing protein [Clostridiales bacterium]|nr:cupin domain-containing protein [Clostridiales bacterium]